MASKTMVSKKLKRELRQALFEGILIGFIFGSFIGLALSSNQTTTPSPTQQIGLLVIVSNSPIPSGIVAYVPIYLNNTRNTTTAPTIFINISRNKYLPYLAYNETAPNQQLSNIEFYYELDNSSYPSGWLGMFFYEKLNYAILMSNSSTIIAMVQLPSSISPNSNMTIYMGFKRD